jgi:hypothetical protein
LHLQLLLSLAFLQMKWWQLIIPNGCQSTNMWCMLGNGFPYSCVLKKLVSLQHLITFLG